MNMIPFHLSLAAALFGIAAASFAQEKKAPRPEPAATPTKKVIVLNDATVDATVDATLEATLTGNLQFESIAGTLNVPGSKVSQLEKIDEQFRLTFVDGSSITGKLGKPVGCETFLGPIELPPNILQFYGVRKRTQSSVGAYDSSGWATIPRVAIAPQQGAEINAGAGDFRYQVMEGDTLQGIARTFITTIDKLKRRNPNLTGNNLKPGMTISIPPLD